jgi:hypothetical protein
VHAARGADGEHFFINDAERPFQGGSAFMPLTEVEFREEFRRRGLSEPEIDEQVTAARKPKPHAGRRRTHPRALGKRRPISALSQRSI